MTTRRQLLAAAIAAPSPEWQSAIAESKAALGRLEAFHAGIYEPYRKQWLEMVADAEADLERRVAAIPHYETHQTFALSDGGSRSMSTAIQIDVLVAADFNRRRADLSREDADYAACCLELHPEAERRKAIEKEMRDSFVRPEFDPAVMAENSRLENESCDAWERVAFFKATTLPDLLAKVAFLKAEDCPIDHDQMLADLARVFGEART